jgi:hypothetical protein
VGGFIRKAMLDISIKNKGAYSIIPRQDKMNYIPLYLLCQSFNKDLVEKQMFCFLPLTKL